MSRAGRLHLLSLPFVAALLLLLSGCRTFFPAIVVSSPGEPESRRLTFGEDRIEWHIEGEELVVSFPVRERGWTALVLGGGVGLVGGDAIIVRSTLYGREIIDAFVYDGFSAVPDTNLGGENELRLIAFEGGRAVVARPLTGDDWDLTIAVGEKLRLVLADGLLGVDSFVLLSMRQTEIEL